MEKDILGNKKIAIIGYGHIGNALVKGLLKSEKINPQNLIISSPNLICLSGLLKKYKVNITQNNKKATIFAEWIIIAVKPFIVKKVIHEIRRYVKNKIIISVAAAVTIKKLEGYIKNNRQKYVRAIPNLPISENQGIIGIYSNKCILAKEEKEINDMFCLLGKTIIVKEEKEIDDLTLITGCGPAIVSSFVELLMNYAIEKGFSKEKSLLIAFKTFEGTMLYLKANKMSPMFLKKIVATKGGITEKMLFAMKKNQINEKFIESIDCGKAHFKKLTHSL